jgi:Lrp/AsnC family leucine-responsive transcriptional regulator
MANITLEKIVDSTDLIILGRVGRDGRATWAALAAELGLTPPAIAARVRRLVRLGVIRQFSACIDAAEMGAVTAFVDVVFADANGHEHFRQSIAHLVAVQECHRIAGAAHYRLKVRTRSKDELELLLNSALPKAAPAATFHVSMVLSIVKETPVFPLPRR